MKLPETLEIMKLTADAVLPTDAVISRGDGRYHQQRV